MADWPELPAEPTAQPTAGVTEPATVQSAAGVTLQSEMEALKEKMTLIQVQLEGRVLELEIQTKAQSLEITALQTLLAERPITAVTSAPEVEKSSGAAAAPAEPSADLPEDEQRPDGIHVDLTSDADAKVQDLSPAEAKLEAKLKHQASVFARAAMKPELRKSNNLSGAQVSRSGSAVWGLSQSQAEDIGADEREIARTMSFVTETYIDAKVHSTGHVSVPIVDAFPNFKAITKFWPLNTLRVDLEMEEEVELEQSIWGELDAQSPYAHSPHPSLFIE